MSQDNTPDPADQTLLPAALTVTGIVGGLLFLVWISAGFFFSVFAGIFLIFAVGSVHYALWGKGLHHDTEGEREEERLRDEAEADRW